MRRVSSAGLHRATQTPFHNLGFESAVIDTPVNNEVPSSDAIPFWNIYSYDPGKVPYDMISAGSYCVSIHDGKGNVGENDFNPLQGQYSLLLQTQFGPTNIDAWISQVGDIPSGKLDLVLERHAGHSYGLAERNRHTGGAAEPSGPAVNGGRPVNTYIGDVRGFSGQRNVELKFESTAFNTLDDIRFSSTIVPEPTALALFAIGSLGLFVVVLRHRRVSRTHCLRPAVR